MFAYFTINYHSCIIIGKGRNSSVPTEVAIAAVTVAVMAVVVMFGRTSKTTVVATIMVVLLLVLVAFWWSGSNTGTFRSPLQDLGVSLLNKT
jgi:serine/threonine-protein phosphatase 5